MENELSTYKHLNTVMAIDSYKQSFEKNIKDVKKCIDLLDD